MISALHHTGSPARADDSFLVRYSGQYPGFYIARILPLFAFFALLALLYLDDESRWIFGRTSVDHKPFSWFEFGFLFTLAMAALLDLALILKRVQRGAIALSVSTDGITGAVRHRSRLLTWDEIEDVAMDGKFLVVRRRPHSILQKLFASRGLGDILIPAHHLDRDVKDILAAVRYFAPLASFPAASH